MYTVYLQHTSVKCLLYLYIYIRSVSRVIIYFVDYIYTQCVSVDVYNNTGRSGNRKKDTYINVIVHTIIEVEENCLRD